MDRPVICGKKLKNGRTLYIEFPPGDEPRPVFLGEMEVLSLILELTNYTHQTSFRIPAKYAQKEKGENG